MELKISSPKIVLSPSDCNSDPEEKEVSDDDDDDRNHKHRRRDARSQSLERDTLDQAFTKPFRKRNKTFQNGNNFRENDSQASAPWRNFNSNHHLEKDFSGKFDKRRPGHASLPRSALDVNQRIWPNQTFSGDPGLARGRGRDLGSWNQRDPRFSSDIASQVVQGSIPPSLFAGRGLPNVSNAQNASWNAFGLIPGIPNGGMDTIHSIGLQGPLRPPIHSSLSIGIPRQRCRDFEERGFCLRGDMCPMEHGVNRIVVEDVQSLSQFNLPVSLPSAHLLGTNSGAGPGSMPSIGASSLTSMNSKGLHINMSKPGFADDVLGLNGSFSGSSCVAGADLYDPDQPLWNNNGPETTNALLGINSPKIDETESLLNGDPSDNEFPVRSTGNAVGSHSTSVWGRIGGSKSRLDVKEKIDPPITSAADYIEGDSKEDKVASTGFQNSFRPGKRIIAEDAGPKPLDSSAKAQFDMRNNRKPPQKALRTLFVNGIPHKNNKREALLSHFQKFGEVIDIYIPLSSERAFVQFSKREEADAALNSPDAVMGNRFIKLFWANRDSIPDDSSGPGTSVSATPRGAVPPHSSVASSSKDSVQAAAPKSSLVHAHDTSVAAFDNPRPIVSNGSKATPPLHKKLETIEQLKIELRKKQEMLDQKRNDFRRKLDKLNKQATGTKGELDMEQPTKRPKVEIAADVAKAATPRSSDSAPVVISQHADTMSDKNKGENALSHCPKTNTVSDKNKGENAVSHTPKSNTTAVLQESMGSKQHPVRPFTPVGSPFLVNRYKLDNRPTAFRILPPLPTGFANVAVMREHFLPYGDISNVELEAVEACNGSSESELSKECSACISFIARRSAERAFTSGKSWQGHDLKFVWLPSSNPSNDQSGGRENSPSAASKEGGENATAGIVPQEVASSGSEEHENQEKKCVKNDAIQGEEECQASPMSDKEVT
ncbi:zinc finger CCCH domain-containing protein 41 [Humulus lupulus]|uniref:zinc finger CCCH domain-containing protein 41 n=1 Tax=Humulus lupulus TaxID=3486 RepID=UPI002B403202|nr:zinc finger CCCH domain-containing protein 41 [Humulus lupulus]